MADKRICDYFVVAGIPTNQQSTTINEASCEGETKCLSPIGSSGTGLPPITDITVIITSEGETVPEGYTCIETTPLGFSADLNHGSLRTQSIFLCYKRGTDKAPLVDIGVLYEAKERVMSDSEVVHTTPFGRVANVNNGTSRTFLTYRRAKDNAPCNQLVVIDICVVLANKGETPPHAYCQINKNLNKGIIGSDVYICYKKSMNRPPLLRYEPSILARFPLVDYDCYSLPQSVPLFCMPMGATVECWPKRCHQPRPLFSTFVLTSNAAVKVYGAAITFYERFDEELLNDDEKSRLNFVSPEDRSSKTLNAVKSICILSRWPFFDTFEKFLTFLYHMTCCSPSVSHSIPIERYISHFMLDVPFPSNQRPKILVQLGISSDETALLSQPPEDMPLPLSGASFTQFLRNLGPENCITVLLLVLAEQKILLHSLRPDVLTSVAEALTSLIFPFHWQCPYIPLCPLALCDVLNAPLPFIAGVDSRYFDMYELPLDVACVDLDTNSIYISEHKKILNIKLLPKRPTRILRSTLEKLYEKLVKPYPRGVNGAGAYNSQCKSRNSSSPFSTDFIAARKHERMIDLEIQEIFVKYMASVLKNFRSYLRLITKAPTIGATDPNSLFNFQGFLKSRDKAHQRFYSIMMKTQMFTRFIEERSFVSDKNTSLAFFDECLDKIEAYGDLENSLEIRLLDIDESFQNDRTVFIPAPEPIAPEEYYIYQNFPSLNESLFHRHPILPKKSFDLDMTDSGNLSRAGSNVALTSPMSRRTKQEIRSAQRIVRRHAEAPLTWAKCLVSYCYSLWFVHLPSFVEANISGMVKAKQLRIAYSVLERMQSLNLHPVDEVCYRILMLLCGLYSQPILAVKVLTEMRRCGVTPNAITYGYYNKAVLESKWPSGDSSASLMWTKLRNVILSVSEFRRCGKTAKLRAIEELDSTSVVAVNNNNNDKETDDAVFTSPGNVESAVTATNMSTPLFSSPVVKLSSNASDVGYCSSVNANETDIDTSNLSIGNTVDDSVVNNIVKNSATKAVKPSPNKQFDRSLSEFRIRARSIVRNSSSNLSCFEDYNSPAGVLMTSSYHGEGSGSSSTLGSPLRDYQLVRKRHKSEDQNQPTPVSSITASSQYNSEPIKCSTSKSNSSNKNSNNNQTKPSYFRSLSFGNDARIIRNIKEGTFKALRAEMETSEPYQTVTNKSASPINSKNRIEKQQQEQEIGADKINSALEKYKLPPCAELPEEDPLRCNDSDSGNKTPDSQSSHQRSSMSNSNSNSPSHSSDNSEEESEEEEDNDDETEENPFSFSPIKDHIMNMSIFSPEGKVASTLRSSFRLATRLAVGPTSTSKSSSTPSPMTRSSTFNHSNSSSHGLVRQKLSNKFNNLFKTRSEDTESPINKKTMTRSATLPASTTMPSPTKTPPQITDEKPPIDEKGGEVCDAVSDDNEEDKTSLSNFGYSPWSIKLASGKHLELVNSTIKSAANTMASRITGIKNTLASSATSSPSKVAYKDATSTASSYIGGVTSGPASLLSQFASLVVEKLPSNFGYDDDDCNSLGSLDFKRLSIAASEDDLSERSREGSLQRNLTGFGFLPQNSSVCPSLFETIEKHYHESLIAINQAMTVVDIEMTSCCRCFTCSSILYDEEIMESWSADDSNLNTQCCFCGSRFVPLLTITLKVLAESSENSETSDVKKLGSHQVDNSYTNSLSQSSNDITDHSQPNNSENITQLKNVANSIESSVPVSNGNNSHGSAFNSCKVKSSFETIEPFTVPYLSPIVLRKELENVLESEGDNCVLKPDFVDDHPILYWNLLWYFERVNLPSHIPGLVLQSSVIIKDRESVNKWISSADFRNVKIHCIWDNHKLHKDFEKPMYGLWRETNETHSSLLHALVTDDRKIQQHLMTQIVNAFQCNDMLTAMNLLINGRLKQGSIGHRKYYSMYRDLLYLSFVTMGRENIDQNYFDREYRRAHEELTAKYPTVLTKVDQPPSFRAIFCRRIFKELELKPFEDDNAKTNLSPVSTLP